ncbi:MAG: hypothetical protein HKP61_10665 [Dactylosporangium sp.]|nr:hypothetical protein [Dactylosporangium sp.]
MTPTTLWRLEWARLVRTHQLLALGALFLLLGLCLPILTANLAWLLERSPDTRDLAATLPSATPAEGIAAYTAQIAQLGLLVLIIGAAGPLCPYARNQPASYVWALGRGHRRGRLPALAAIVLPRFLARAAWAVAAFLLGLGGAWYETAVLIGAPDPARLLAGALLGSLYLVWAIAVVAVIGAWASSAAVTASMAVLAVLLTGIAEIVPGAGRAMPTRLIEAPGELLRGAELTSYLPAAGVAVALTAGLVIAASALLDRREL